MKNIKEVRKKLKKEIQVVMFTTVNLKTEKNRPKNILNIK